MLETYLRIEPGRIESATASSECLAQEALVLSRLPGGAVLLTHHNVIGRNEKSARLGEGVPVSRQHAMSMLAQLSQSEGTEWLPGCVVANSPLGMAWWSPARRGAMHWQLGARARQMVVPWPTLYFVAGFGHALRVFALKQDGRPSPTTPLYQAPIANVYDDGRLCWGNIPEPACALSAIPDFESAIYRTNNTHSNTTRAFRSYRREGNTDNMVQLWSGLHREKATSFPPDELVAIKRTAGDVLRIA